MKSQKEAERAEQQRIKNLVLNYELQDTPDQDGTDTDLPYFYRYNPNLSKNYFKPSDTVAHDESQGPGGERHQHNATLHQSSPHHTRSRSSDKPGGNRGSQRARKLQLSDVDWYDKSDGEGPDIEPAASSRRRGRGRGRSGRSRHIAG